MKMFAKVYSDLDNSDIDNEVLLPPPKRIWDRSGRWASTLSAWRFASVLVLACLTVAVSILSFIALEHQLQHPFRVPELPAKEPCEHAIARPSWHTLPLHRRHGYKRAVERLTTLPSRLGLNTSLYDDFTYVHIQLVWQTHHTAVSLPYHRYFLSVFEETLRIDGGYDQPIPFWDWTLDADQPFASPVWDEFGGFGPAVSGCTAAKLANYSEHGYHPHCVQRTFNSSPEDGIMHSNRWTKDIVTDLIENSNTYDQFRGELERGVHKHLHLGIGGEMPTASSTNGEYSLEAVATC